MIIIEIIILCFLFFLICYLNTGSDEKNIKSYYSYPDAIQAIVRENPKLSLKIKLINPLVSFLFNIR